MKTKPDIAISRKDFEFVFKALDQIVVSLGNIARATNHSEEALAIELRRYVQKEKIAVKLAQARKRLDSYLETSLIKDKSEVEILCKNQKYWKVSHRDEGD